MATNALNPRASGSPAPGLAPSLGISCLTFTHLYTILYCISSDSGYDFKIYKRMDYLILSLMNE